MNQKSDRRSDTEVLNEVADRYRAEGFRVSVRPSSNALPEGLREFEPDILATRGAERVLVEVKRGKSSSDLPRALSLMTQRAQSMGWRVDLVSEPERESPTWPRARREELQDDSLRLLEEGHREAAVLLASSALEGTLRALASRNRVEVERQYSIRQLINLLQSRGVLGPSTSGALSHLVEARNRAAHARSIGRVSMTTLREAIELARWLDSSEYVTPEEMVDWFFEIFEDPAEWVPYESKEGGYQYPSGEPHDAQEVLFEKYPNAPEAAISDAVELIEPLGMEWVKKQQV
jgi:HEPN domain-containing protein